ncbi:MAG: glycosyltransferase [Candidatus Marinimicrobia bacterium]|jgi:glycosyltransferase involved in cell wall biosynthesis|nr:glycosyltransferase [Candidatus Neomarinimicrobiota bacterium]
MLKVALISHHDYAGSGYRMAEAVNMNSKTFAEYFAYVPMSYPSKLPRYPALFVRNEDKHFLPSETASRLQTLFRGADIIHYKGDDPPDSYYMKELDVTPNKTIVTVHGSMFRRDADEKIARPVAKLSDYDSCTLRTVGDPTLAYDGFDCIFTQIPYPTHKFDVTWENRKTPVIAHSPSTKDKKGTDKFEEAIEKLQKAGYDVKSDIIHNVNYKECLKRKSEATIFFDQSEVGWYGNSAVEAMAFGIPTLAYISPEAFKGAQGKLDAMPPIDCGNTVDSIFCALKGILDGDMVKQSKAMRKWAVDFHSYKTVGEMWDKIYRGL